MLVAIPLEEQGLIAIHGDAYRNYRDSVPSLVPRLRKSGEAVQPTIAAQWPDRDGIRQNSRAGRRRERGREQLLFVPLGSRET